MIFYEFNLEHPINYALTGKFKAPYEHWMHDDMPLNDYELFVVTSGTLYISYNLKKYAVSEGEMLLLPPVPEPNNRRKGFHPSGCSFYWLHFSCNHDLEIRSMPENTNEDTKTSPNTKYITIPAKAKLPSPDKVIVFMKQLQDCIRSNYNDIARNYMTSMILCEIHNQFHTISNMNLQTKKTQSQMYHDIVDYVVDRISKNIKVSEIATEFGYNEKYISHLFFTISGMTLKQFILKTKMDNANFLLTDTNKSINEIALSLGYSDSHNFMKAYKKIIGLTPSEYRNAFSKRLLFDK